MIALRLITSDYLCLKKYLLFKHVESMVKLNDRCLRQGFSLTKIKNEILGKLQNYKKIKFGTFNDTIKL